ncbi:MAG: proton-conducting transporter membrane subunit [Clostridia bacterium]|nr:proton-conducting transporter membrane subunit [Clostridia bacterium]
MSWWANIPLFSIILCLLSAALCSVLKAKAARVTGYTALVLCVSGGVGLLSGLLAAGGSVTFMMGHFPAPWGNEIRFGRLEALLAIIFPLIMLMSLSGGAHRMAEQVTSFRENLYYTVCLLLNAALLSQIYTNDLFTGYVFLEIMTLASCGLIIARSKGKTLVSAMRYMILNLIGSGLFLLGVILLYDVTGHLLMENIRQALEKLYAAGEYRTGLTVIIALITVGLCIKSALFPFHTWVPDAYSNGTPSSNAILSSLVSKGYIILLIKCYYRVFGPELISGSGINSLIMLLALAGMIIGSVDAIRTKQFGRMIAYSSVAQIGYIYLGIALGTEGGYAAAIFHLILHSASKSLLFLSGDALRAVSGESREFRPLSGAGRRAKGAGAAFTLGAFSLVGLPFTGGFVTKLLLGREALNHSVPVTVAVLAVLVVSTLLNILYFLRTVILIWSPGETIKKKVRFGPAFGVSMIILGTGILACFFLASPLLDLIRAGLTNFG